MTTQLPSRELLQKIIETANEIITVNNGTNEDISKNDTNTIIGLNDNLNDDLANPSVVKALAEFALAAHEQEPVGHVIQQLRGYENPTYVVQMTNEPEDGDEVFSHPAPVPAVPECFERLLAHAQGIAMGVDWNKGTAATHHRDKLCQAVKDCAAMLNGGKS